MLKAVGLFVGLGIFVLTPAYAKSIEDYVVVCQPCAADKALLEKTVQQRKQDNQHAVLVDEYNVNIYDAKQGKWRQYQTQLDLYGSHHNVVNTPKINKALLKQVAKHREQTAALLSGLKANIFEQCPLLSDFFINTDCRKLVTQKLTSLTDNHSNNLLWSQLSAAHMSVELMLSNQYKQARLTPTNGKHSISFTANPNTAQWQLNLDKSVFASGSSINDYITNQEFNGLTLKQVSEYMEIHQCRSNDELLPGNTYSITRHDKRHITLITEPAFELEDSVQLKCNFAQIY